MIVATRPTTYTPDDLLAMPDGDRYELVDGRLVELSMSGLSSLVGANVNRLVGNFVHEHKLGAVFNAECGYRCFPEKPLKVRKPDASFIRAGRLSRNELEQGYLPVAPDLAVEVVSPNDKAYELAGKVEEYLAAGVRLVWVVYPETQVVEVSRLDGSVSRLHASDELSGEDVLPGFRCPVGELFSLADLAHESDNAHEPPAHT